MGDESRGEATYSELSLGLLTDTPLTHSPYGFANTNPKYRNGHAINIVLIRGFFGFDHGTILGSICGRSCGATFGKN